MHDNCLFGSVAGLASAEKPAPGNLGRILMLALDIVEAILDGRHPEDLGVHVLREGFPVEWGHQRLAFVAERPPPTDLGT